MYRWLIFIQNTYQYTYVVWPPPKSYSTPCVIACLHALSHRKVLRNESQLTKDVFTARPSGQQRRVAALRRHPAKCKDLLHRWNRDIMTPWWHVMRSWRHVLFMLWLTYPSGTGWVAGKIHLAPWQWIWSAASQLGRLRKTAWFDGCFNWPSMASFAYTNTYAGVALNSDHYPRVVERRSWNSVGKIAGPYVHVDIFMDESSAESSSWTRGKATSLWRTFAMKFHE